VQLIQALFRDFVKMKAIRINTKGLKRVLSNPSDGKLGLNRGFVLSKRQPGTEFGICIKDLVCVELQTRMTEIDDGDLEAGLHMPFKHGRIDIQGVHSAGHDLCRPFSLSAFTPWFPGHDAFFWILGTGVGTFFFCRFISMVCFGTNLISSK